MGISERILEYAETLPPSLQEVLSAIAAALDLDLDDVVPPQR